jgi:hypothetical protein
MRRARASGLASGRRCWIGEEKIADVVLGAMVLQGALRERFGLDAYSRADGRLRLRRDLPRY